MQLMLKLVLIGCMLMCVSSYKYYSTFGIDIEPVINNKVFFHYYRLWFTGKGDVLLGHGVAIKDYDPAKIYDKFDLAATFFQTPFDNKPQPLSAWNRLGFWYVSTQMPNQQFWLGIPALLPVLIIGFFMLKRFCKRLRYKLVQWLPTIMSRVRMQQM